MPTTIDHKARLIQSAVWPFALYTADTNYVGASHIAKLRRAALNALVGTWNNSCPWLLGLVLSKHITDPFVFILQNIFRLLRRLASIRMDLAQKFVQMTCEHTSSRAWGPASALCLYLGRLGWKLNVNGFLEVSSTKKIDVLKTSSKEIAVFLSEVWPDYVLKQVNRKGFGDFHIHPGITIKAFEHIPYHQQPFVALTMVGGFQTEGQKAKWANDTEGLCKLCDQKDCHRHAFLDCPALLECRKGYEEEMDILENIRPEWIYFPIARRHPRVNELELFISSIKLPQQPFSSTLGHQHRVFYTDGGCHYPTDRYARMASWSVVEDISQSQSEQEQTLASTDLSQFKIPQFRSLGVGIVSLKQTASRGELTALVLALQSAIYDDSCQSADIFVDAQYLLNLVSMIESSSHDDWTFRKPNADLLHLLFQLWTKKSFHLYKLRSHRNLGDAESSMDLWQILGNSMADLGATASLDKLPLFIKDLSRDIAAFHKKELKMLKKVLKFIAVVNASRVKQIAEMRSHTKNGGHTDQVTSHMSLMPPTLNGDEALDFLGSFDHPEYISLPQKIFDEQCLHACFQGANIAKAVSIWCYTLKWPPNICDLHDYKRKDDWGISWLELFFNFCLCTRMFFPIRIDGRSKDSVYIGFHSDIAMLNYGSKRVANMQTLCMERLIRTLEKLQLFRLFPSFQTNQCKSLMRFGYTGKHTGVPCRPLMHKQQETMEWVRKFLGKARCEGHLGLTPILPEGSPSISFPALNEISPDKRWAEYFKIKGQQRRNRLAADDGA